MPVEDLWTSFLHRGLARPKCCVGTSGPLPKRAILSRLVITVRSPSSSSLAAKHWLKQISQIVDPEHHWRQSVNGFGAMSLTQLKLPIKVTNLCVDFQLTLSKLSMPFPGSLPLRQAKLLGVDQGTLQVWAGALAGFRRHFVIQGSYKSPGVTSCNGFLEGCATSCVAMVVLADLFHKWIRATNVTFRPVSCVDTWAILLQSPESMQSACEAVDRFAIACFTSTWMRRRALS